MEDKRKDLIVAGLYLGDITLVLAALAKELPPYAEGFELERVIPEAESLQPLREEVEGLLAGRSGINEIPSALVRKILDTAIEKGKFHSATRCLALLGERDTYVDRFVAGAGEKTRSGDAGGAARDIVIASNLESEAGFPLFQISGPELHAECASSPQACPTRAPADEAVSKALEYLLEGEKVSAFVGGLSADQKKSLLPHVASERDPNLHEFFGRLRVAHTALGEMGSGVLEALRKDCQEAAGAAARLAESLRGASAGDDSAGKVLDRARRTAGGLLKDFEGIDTLIDDLQLRRVKRRIGNLLESENDLRSAAEVIKQDSAEGGAVGSAIALIETFREKGILEKIDEIQAKLTGLQVGLLGRPVHSQEHWQYLRELAFKYPVSPLVCCIRKLNDRHMVVPNWDSHLTGIIRDFLEGSA